MTPPGLRIDLVPVGVLPGGCELLRLRIDGYDVSDPLRHTQCDRALPAADIKDMEVVVQVR
jgi:hypothetical protein